MIILLIISLIALIFMLLATLISEQLNRSSREKHENYRLMQLDIDIRTIYMDENPNAIIREVNNIEAYRRKRDAYDCII